MISRKVGTSGNKMVYAEGTFLWWGLCIPSSRTIAYVVDKQNSICRGNLPLHRLCVPSVETTTYVCNDLIFLSVLNTPGYTKFKSKGLKQINSNLGRLSRGSLLPSCPNEITSLKTISLTEFAYTSSIWYIWLFWPISVLTKNLSKKKKFIYRIFSNKRPLSFKRRSPINAQYNPRNIL